MNKAFLMGNLGRDPELSYTDSGMAIAKFNIATTERWADKISGEKQKYTEWHRITVFGRLAEICGEYLCKGRQVLIEGRIQTTSWQKDGVKRFFTEIIATNIEMLGRKMPENIPEPVVGDNHVPF